VVRAGVSTDCTIELPRVADYIRAAALAFRAGIGVYDDNVVNTDQAFMPGQATYRLSSVRVTVYMGPCSRVNR